MATIPAFKIFIKVIRPNQTDVAAFKSRPPLLTLFCRTPAVEFPTGQSSVLPTYGVGTESQKY